MTHLFCYADLDTGIDTIKPFESDSLKLSNILTVLENDDFSHPLYSKTPKPNLPVFEKPINKIYIYNDMFYTFHGSREKSLEINISNYDIVSIAKKLTAINIPFESIDNKKLVLKNLDDFYAALYVCFRKI